MSVSSIQNRVISTFHLNRIAKSLNDRQKKVIILANAIFNALANFFRYFQPKHTGKMSFKNEDSFDIQSYLESSKRAAWQGVFLDQVNLPYIESPKQSVDSDQSRKDNVEKTPSKSIKREGSFIETQSYLERSQRAAWQGIFLDQINLSYTESPKQAVNSDQSRKNDVEKTPNEEKDPPVKGTSHVLQVSSSTQPISQKEEQPVLSSTDQQESSTSSQAPVLDPTLLNSNQKKTKRHVPTLEELEKKWKEEEKLRLETEFKARTHPDIFSTFEAPKSEEIAKINRQIALLEKDIVALQETLANKDLTNRTQLTTLLFEKREMLETLGLDLQGPKKLVRANSKELPMILAKYTNEELKIIIGMIFKGKRPQEGERFYYLYSPAIRAKREYAYSEEERNNNSGDAKVKKDILDTNEHNKSRERDTQLNLSTRQLVDEILDNWETISNSPIGQAFLKHEQAWNKYLMDTNAPFIDLLLRRIKYGKLKQEIEEKQFDTAQEREKAINSLRNFANYTEEPLYVERPFQPKKANDRSVVITQKEDGRKIDPTMLNQMMGQLRSVKNQISPKDLISPLSQSEEEDEERTKKPVSSPEKEEQVSPSEKKMDEQLSPHSKNAEPSQSATNGPSTTQTSPKASQASESDKNGKEEDKKGKSGSNPPKNDRQSLLDAIKGPHNLRKTSATQNLEAEAQKKEEDKKKADELLRKIESGELNAKSDLIQEALKQGLLKQKQVEISQKIYQNTNTGNNLVNALNRAIFTRRGQVEVEEDEEEPEDENDDWN